MPSKTTKVVPVRVPLPMLMAIQQAAGGNVSAWAIRAFRAALEGQFGAPTLDGAHREGWDEGRRAGWSAANRAFRDALAVASAKLKSMQP